MCFSHFHLILLGWWSVFDVTPNFSRSVFPYIVYRYGRDEDCALAGTCELCVARSHSGGISVLPWANDMPFTSKSFHAGMLLRRLKTTFTEQKRILWEKDFVCYCVQSLSNSGGSIFLDNAAFPLDATWLQVHLCKWGKTTRGASWSRLRVGHNTRAHSLHFITPQFWTSIT